MNKEIFKRIFSSLILIPVALFFVIKGSFYFAFFLFVVLMVALAEWEKISGKNFYREFGLIFLFFSNIAEGLFNKDLKPCLISLLGFILLMKNC